MGVGGSHPSWVCGLKQSEMWGSRKTNSHTLRGCVDWNIFQDRHPFRVAVTPFVGVWIETSRPGCWCDGGEGHTLRGCVDWNCYRQHLGSLLWVTPFVGVWIETMVPLFLGRMARVTPFVGVWIETHRLKREEPHTRVTPFVGVWIETSCSVWWWISCWSHPSWVCGLKLCRNHKRMLISLSHPSWVCGLKHDTHQAKIYH